MSEGSGGTGVGFFSLLTIVFIVLKLCNVIDWAWVWVLSPIWISAIIAVVVVIIYLIVAYVSNK